VLLRRFLWLLAPFVALCAMAACDDDPTQPQVNFALTCPTSPQSVNAPIALQFTQRVLPSSVTGANVIISSAATGLEIPGSLALDPGGEIVRFSSSSPLPFDQIVRVRVQNLLADSVRTPLAVQVCEIRTTPAPISQLFWRALPSATGTNLFGVSVIGADSGYISSEAGPIFRREADNFRIVFDQPFFSTTFDVGFVNRLTGFSSHFDNRRGGSFITRTVNAGIAWDTLQFIPAFQSVNRLFFRSTGPGVNDVFGIAGGGSSSNALFLRYAPATRTFTTSATIDEITANVEDISFSGTSTGAAVTDGSRRFDGSLRPGRVYVTSNGGTTWSEVPNAVANETSQEYRGVARRANGEIWVTGGSGYVLRLTPSGSNYTVARVLQGAVQNPDSTDPRALVYTDVEFAPDNDLRGWIVGAQIVGTVGGVPRYQGLIFETTDGGATWTRQGVVGAPDFGASFPKLNRLSVRTSTTIWAVGDGGIVLEYRP
jgi:photosystem II stability/assembly factor-like uncharacterized protein